MQGPVGPVVEAKPSVLLRVTLEEGDWKKFANALTLKLLELEGVTAATIGEKGNITLHYDDTAPDEAAVKKLVLQAGMKFVSMAPPARVGTNQVSRLVTTCPGLSPASAIFCTAASSFGCSPRATLSGGVLPSSI